VSVIPSGAPKARRRGIAIIPKEGMSLYQEDRDSSPPALRASARNDSRYLSFLTLNLLHITIVVHDEFPGDWNSAGVFEPV
jgi:hypothetical protein